MTPPRTAAPHVQAALSRTAQARLSPPAPGRPSAPHVQAKIAAVQTKIALPPVARPVAAHVQAKIAAPTVRPPAAHVQAKLPPVPLPPRAPHLPPVPPAVRPVAQARTLTPPPPAVSRPSALLAPLPARPVTAALQRKAAVIQPATQVSYFTSAVARRARHYRRDNDVGGANLATVCYQIQNDDDTWGPRKYKTMPSAGEHSEKRLHDYLEALPYVYRVRWVYTELAPCGSDYHNCAQRLENWWPNAEVYYSVDYPSLDDVSSESSDDERQTKKRDKAKRRRSRGPATLERFKTKSRKYDSDEDDPPGPGDFKPVLRTIYSPPHYSSGWEL